MSNPELSATFVITTPHGESRIVWTDTGLRLTGTPNGKPSHVRDLPSDHPAARLVAAALGEVGKSLALAALMVPSRPEGD